MPRPSTRSTSTETGAATAPTQPEAGWEESPLADQRITVAGLLFETQAALVRRLDADLRAATGMPLATFEVLVRLARSPGGRLRLAELSRQLSITTGGVTRLVDRIEGDGLLRREPCPTDRRVTYARITEPGAHALANAVTVHLAALQRDIVDPLETHAYTALAAALRVLRDNLTGDPVARIESDTRPQASEG